MSAPNAAVPQLASPRSAFPRAEYPRPQFVRPDWLCLNGQWQFEMDFGDSGIDHGLHKREFKDKIIVPFCPESPLSGIGYTDFIDAVWYRRTIEIPREWAGKRVLLHFQAVDYDATVWVNDQEVYRHRGGYTPFTCDLHGIVSAGETATIVVRARDKARELKASGKQSKRYKNEGVLYTRTTGIWQTVWMEPVPITYLKRPRITPDVANSTIRIEQPLSGNPAGSKLRAVLKDAQGEVCSVTCRADLDFAPRLDFIIPENRRRLWSIEDPYLYDLEIEFLNADGFVIDRLTSYAGLRSVAIDGLKVKINGKSVFQRLVLDQGFYPDGICTAPTDEALRRDIEISMAAGFNGARLHQKVFEERFLYWADKLGYLCWGEFADWGCRWPIPHGEEYAAGITYTAQWLESLERDYSHPSIIGWCGLNESMQKLTEGITNHDDTQRAMFLAAKAMDTTRPVIDVSGFAHRIPESDIWDAHDYEQDTEKTRQNYECMKDSKLPETMNKNFSSIPWRGQPFFISEFGGIFYHPETDEGHGHFNMGRFKGKDELHKRFADQVGVLLDNPRMFGYCYTQLTDVYQEVNGIYDFNRQPKFDIEKVRVAQQRVAAIEEASAIRNEEMV